MKIRMFKKFSTVSFESWAKNHVAHFIVGAIFAVATAIPGAVFASPKECEFCKHDHKNVCAQECVGGDTGSPEKCSTDCIVQKCSSACSHKVKPPKDQTVEKAKAEGEKAHKKEKKENKEKNKEKKDKPGKEKKDKKEKGSGGKAKKEPK